MVIVLIGPSGCGKTTIGRLLADKLGYPFEDADDFHPPKNVAKMRAGIPLEDRDRMAWLTILSSRIKDRKQKGENLVLACSALKQWYRDLLGIDQIEVISIYLKGSFDLLQERIANRQHRYMSKGLLSSQVSTMEEPTHGLTVDIGKDPAALCEEIIAGLNERKETKR